MKNRKKQFKKAGLLLALTICTQITLAQEALFIGQSGNVGIGTGVTDPPYTLTLGGERKENVLGIQNGGIFYAKNTTGSYEKFLCPRGFDDRMHLHYGKEGFFVTNNAGALTMCMTKDGKVGIGTNDPKIKLTVSGTGTVLGIDKGAELGAWNGSSYETYLIPRTNDNIMYLKYGTGGFRIHSSASLNAMYINTDGKVAIGNIDPKYNLEVEGNIGLRGTHLVFNSKDGVIDWGAGSLIFRKLSTEGDITKYTDLMVITADGNLGIGTGTPTKAKIVIENFIEYKGLQTAFRYMNKTDANQHDAGKREKDEISIWASKTVIADQYFAISDARIKTNFTRADNRNDLALLNKFRVTDYEHNDFVSFSGIRRGFIAQEVEEIFPQAITKNTSFIPDIFDMAASVSLQDSVLTVTMKKSHNLATGDVVRLVPEDGKLSEMPVAVVNATTFTVSHWAMAAKGLFVYGKQVDDLRAVDYQQIFSLSISAIQELSKKADALEAENNKLKSQQQAQQNLVANIESRLQALEERQDAHIKTAKK